MIGIWRTAFVVASAFLLTGPLRKWVEPKRTDVCADLIADAVMRSGGGLNEVKIVSEWVGRESGCNPRAVSSDGLDCGIIQQRGQARHGVPCAVILNDPSLALDMWLSDLERLRNKTSSVFRALEVLSCGSGGCPGLVRRRCVQAGLGVDCASPP